MVQLIYNLIAQNRKETYPWGRGKHEACVTSSQGSSLQRFIHVLAVKLQRIPTESLPAYQVRVA
jgi:hypothetical protein